MNVAVECYAGYRGEQTPRAFTLGDRQITVREVVDQWLAPDHRYFKVTDATGDTYILRHDGPTDRWDLVVFESAPPRAGEAGR